MSLSSQRFKPYYDSTTGFVHLSPTFGYGVGALLDRFHCLVDRGVCRAIVMWQDAADNTLWPVIYIPEDDVEAAELVPEHPTLVDIAQMLASGRLTSFRDTVAADQIYRYDDENGRSGMVCTLQSSKPGVTHLLPDVVYYEVGPMGDAPIDYFEMLGHLPDDSDFFGPPRDDGALPPAPPELIVDSSGVLWSGPALI